MVIYITAPQLFPSERVVWQGHPPTGLVFRPIEFFLIPFSLLWGGFALFWNGMAWVTGAPFVFKLAGLPFLIAGFYVTIGRFLIEAYIRRKTQYFVSDRRILVVKKWLARDNEVH